MEKVHSGEKWEKLRLKIILISTICWLICILGVFATIFYVVGVRKEYFDQTPEIFAFLLLGLILLGGVVFLIGSSLVIIHILLKSERRKNKFLFIFQFIFIYLVLPFFLIAYILNPLAIFKKIKKLGIVKGFSPRNISLSNIFVKSFGLIVAVFILLPVWLGGYATSGLLVKEQLNLVEDQISLAGTGSMYPTFPKGHGKTEAELTKEIVSTPGMRRYPSGLNIFGREIFNYSIKRGDIVSFSNEKTDEITQRNGGEKAGFVKRVVAIPGDKIEIREGLFFLNGKPQKEKYIARSRSTFGGVFLQECRVLAIPEGKIFVMGDNRKGSGDSRHELGLIGFDDIDHVIPWEEQNEILSDNWRDTEDDLNDISKMSLDKEKYIALLNNYRKENGVKNLKIQSKLEQSAQKRGEVILKFDDYSFEATRSGYTMSKAMQEVGYSNIVFGEFPTPGYYEAEELLENQFQFPESKEFLLDNDYQEIGISEVEGMVNGCPTHVIIQHLAGYVPPNYSQADIDGWKKSLFELKDIQGGWSSLKDSSEFYEKNKSDVDRINHIISTRISNISTIVTRMEANQWLTSAEKSMMNQDMTLYEEQESTANRLNNISY